MSDSDRRNHNFWAKQAYNRRVAQSKSFAGSRPTGQRGFSYRTVPEPPALQRPMGPRQAPDRGRRPTATVPAQYGPVQQTGQPAFPTYRVVKEPTKPEGWGKGVRDPFVPPNLRKKSNTPRRPASPKAKAARKAIAASPKKVVAKESAAVEKAPTKVTPASPPAPPPKPTRKPTEQVKKEIAARSQPKPPKKKRLDQSRSGNPNLTKPPSASLKKRPGAPKDIGVLVNKMELNLGIVHMPTGFRVSFPAFLDTFNDAYTSEWIAEGVYGRMDPIANFTSTERVLSLGWHVPASSFAHGEENLSKINKLISFMYPLYEGSNKFDFGATSINQSPLIRIKFGNLVQSAVTGDGLLGYVRGITFDPAMEYGMFTKLDPVSGAQYFPKTYRLNLELKVLHDHRLGYKVVDAQSNQVISERTSDTTGITTTRTRRKIDTRFGFNDPEIAWNNFPYGAPFVQVGDAVSRESRTGILESESGPAAAPAQESRPQRIINEEGKIVEIDNFPAERNRPTGQGDIEGFNSRESRYLVPGGGIIQ